MNPAKSRAATWPGRARALVLPALLWLILPGPPRTQAISSGTPANEGRAQPTREPVSLRAKALPFTAGDVIDFLSHNFQITPEEARPGHFVLRFADSRLPVLRMEPIRMEIRTIDSQIEVTFSFQEFNAMHYVAEFMECPLFTRAEAEQLYALIYDKKHPGWRRFARFLARAEFIQTAAGTQARFVFAPLP